MPDIGLLVVRVSDLERSRRWYEVLGLTFREEKHGEGPLHYAATEDDFVIELYPASQTNPVPTGIRLGFRVPDVRATVAAMRSPESVIVEPVEKFGRLCAVLIDPDGIKVEVVEHAK